MKRLVVVGAGAVGLPAALLALDRGFDVTVLEQHAPGAALLRWGSTRLFSPLAMNVPPRVREVLDGRLPAADALLTGPQMVDSVLRPLAEAVPLAGRVLTGHRVLAIGRAGLTRMDFAGHPLRAERPFRILATSPEGERTFEADLVLDATGVTGRATWLGPGGLPARGEQALGEHIVRDLGTLDDRLGRLCGARVLLVGHGHSAAGALLRLAERAAADADLRVTWAVRCANRRPCAEVAGDPLPERRRVAACANALAEDPPPFLRVERRASVEALEPHEAALEVTLTGGHGGRFDVVAGLTGYRPDLSFLSELNVEVSSVTEGAHRLARALSNVTDCLSIPRVRPEDLQSGEPGFFLAGAKSYGRARSFLIRTGLAQVETMLDMMRPV